RLRRPVERWVRSFLAEGPTVFWRLTCRRDCVPLHFPMTSSCRCPSARILLALGAAGAIQVAGAARAQGDAPGEPRTVVPASTVAPPASPAAPIPTTPPAASAPPTTTAPAAAAP